MKAARIEPPDRSTQREVDTREQGNQPPATWALLSVVAVSLLGIWFLTHSAQSGSDPVVDYSDFYSWIEQGSVESVSLHSQQLRGSLKTPKKIDGVERRHVVTVRPTEDVRLLPLLHDQKVRVSVVSDDRNPGAKLFWALLPWIFGMGVFFWFARKAPNAASGSPLTRFAKSNAKRFDKASSVAVSLDDVAGLEGAKRDLREVVDFLKAPERFKRLGGRVPRGVLLVGPPGTGKTLLARAVAGEAGVPFFSTSASEFIEMFVGVGAARVRQLFVEARKDAPAIIFIDELDAVGRARGAGLGGGHDEREQTLNQLLSEMDGFERDDLTIVLAATNRPDVLDPALLRAGRFDRTVVVERPARAARGAILQVHAQNKPLAQDVDLLKWARETVGFSGADLANLVNEAALAAARDASPAINEEHFRSGYDKIVLGNPRETVLLRDERERVAVHESGHAVVARLSPDSDPPRRVSILPRGLNLGVTQQAPSEDRLMQTESQLMARLCVLMGGYAAERLVFGQVSTGAENDLKEATKIADQMVSHFGMSPELGAIYYEHSPEHPFLGQRIATNGGVSEATMHAIEIAAQKSIARALHDSSEILRKHRPQLDALTALLLEEETVELESLNRAFALTSAAPLEEGGALEPPLEGAGIH